MTQTTFRLRSPWKSMRRAWEKTARGRSTGTKYGGVEGIDLELLLVDDIDGDGRDDLIITIRDPQNGEEQRLYVVRSLGDGQWADVQPVSEDDYVLETVCATSDWDAAIEELAFARDATVGANGLVAFVPAYVEGGNDSDDSAARLVLDFRPALRSGVTELAWIADDASREPADALSIGHESGETGYELASAQSRPRGQDPRSRPPRERYTIVVERVEGGRRARQRLLSRTNRVIARRLRSGAYQVKYRAQVIQGRKVVARTSFSPASNFSVGQRVAAAHTDVAREPSIIKLNDGVLSIESNDPLNVEVTREDGTLVLTLNRSRLLLNPRAVRQIVFKAPGAQDTFRNHTGISGTPRKGPNRPNVLVYTPWPGFVGTDQFQYTISDGRGGSATGTVEIVVTAPREHWTLVAGQRLLPGQEVRSADNQYRFVLQTDGNFVLYNNSRAVWHTRTAGHPGARLVVLNTGNVVIRAPGNGILWQAR